MIGPYLFESSWRERCAKVPSWWRLPNIGSFGGEGGGLGRFLEGFLVNSKIKMVKEKREMKNSVEEGKACSMREGAIIALKWVCVHKL